MPRPGVEWSGAPRDAKSFALVMDDPDASQPKPFVHWLVYDIPGDVAMLREGLPTEPVLQDPEGVKQGTNSVGATGYFGPKPPVEDPAHHYHFQVFALDVTTLGIAPGATREEIVAAMQGHVLAVGEIVGTFKRGEASAENR
jgi:Raf kinase inhibitor-like YbhB/YbcL family protein